MTKHLFILCASLSAPLAQAHVTLEQQSAVASSNYKAVFRVGHGCDGSPTTAVTVFLPEGFVGGKPMPKAGWKLDVRTEKLARPYESHGKPVTERAAQFTWSGGRLLDAEYDEFVVRVTLPEKVGKQWIRVLQQCEKGQNDWAEVPVEGKPRPAMPPAALEIVPAPAPAAPAAHSHH